MNTTQSELIEMADGTLISNFYIRVCFHASVLGDVLHQTPEICMKAVERNGNALKYVLHQTPEICIAAVNRDSRAIKYVHNKTPEIYLEFVKNYGMLLSGIEEQYQTDEICLAAVKNDGLALEFVKKPTQEIREAALTENGTALQFISEEDQTGELCLLAMIQKECESYLNPGREKVRRLSVFEQYGHALKHVKNQTISICLKAVERDRGSLKYIIDPEMRKICEKYLEEGSRFMKTKSAKR